MPIDKTVFRAYQISAMRQHFDEVTDNRGACTQEECAVLLRSFRQAPSESELQSTLQSLFKESPNGLTFEKFFDLLTSSYKKIPDAELLIHVFNSFDPQSTGYLSEPQMRELMREGPTPLAEAEITLFLNAMEATKRQVGKEKTVMYDYTQITHKIINESELVRRGK